ncbi:methyltransferase [Tateyamaria sp. Alg231-49]|uniref:methyltransferase n=1 Tax=Tateyamaria sp. Alg231-49 TaxID=1922219 RepID=UPI000D54BD86|nr:methyltransferase [Tateyamaria sp. Alg231-49]
MTDVPVGARVLRGRGWAARLIASRKFQKWAAGFLPTRGIVRREGEALFDLLSGFCQSQILMALVQFDIPQMLLARPRMVDELAQLCDVPPARMVILMRAAEALALVKQKRGGRFVLARRGAALVGVPGLADMIKHHDILYRDLADSVAFFRGETKTELADFWPYVFGGEMDADVAKTYSDLMAQSQELVAEDTLRALDFSKATTLLDVGGGSGAFLEKVGRAYPKLDLMLFDLPKVAPSAAPRFAAAGMMARAQIAEGSFVHDPIPTGADAISLVRVLYDHSDTMVAALLAKCHAALADDGLLYISEPMSGGDAPERAGDVYFALYTLAMQTGKARSIAEISALCTDAGFEVIATPKPLRSFVTRCLLARKLNVNKY